MSSHPNESNEGSRICAKAVDSERSVPVAEPDTLKDGPYTTSSLLISYRAPTASYCWNLTN